MRRDRDAIICGVSANLSKLFLWTSQIDSLFIADPTKFISGVLCSLSAMVQLELPHINVLTKCDLVDEKELSKYVTQLICSDNNQELFNHRCHSRNQSLDVLYGQIPGPVVGLLAGEPIELHGPKVATT